MIPKLDGLAVTIPSAAAHLVAKKSVRAARAAGGRLLGLVENMSGYVCPNCWEVGPLFARQPGGERLAAELALPFLGSIPFDPRLTRACDEGLPFVLGHPGAPTARALLEVVEGMLEAGL